MWAQPVSGPNHTSLYKLDPIAHSHVGRLQHFVGHDSSPAPNRKTEEVGITKTSGDTAITQGAHEKYLRYKVKKNEYSRLLKEGPEHTNSSWGSEKQHSRYDTHHHSHHSPGRDHRSSYPAGNSYHGRDGRYPPSFGDATRPHHYSRGDHTDLRRYAHSNAGFGRQHPGSSMPPPPRDHRFEPRVETRVPLHAQQFADLRPGGTHHMSGAQRIGSRTERELMMEDAARGRGAPSGRSFRYIT